MIKKWNVVSSEQLESNKIFSTRKDTSISPITGNEHDFFVVEAPDWINVVAITEDDEVILIEQYRHGVQSVTVEIPGGMVDPGEEPLQTAKRELLEETGYAGNNWVSIGEVFPNPAMQNNKCYTFLATNCKKVGEPNFDTTEDILTYTKPSSEIPKLVAEGKITHSLVVAAFYWYYLYKEAQAKN
jgi:8-oxo-dGTP pyrophosphatase MutT (NUDIX family)